MRHVLVASFLFADWCWRDPTESCQTDADADGYADCLDCDDSDPAVHPDGTEIAGNCSDEDCDGALEEAVESADLVSAGGVLLCGEGYEEAGASLLSLSESVPGASGLLVGAPRRNAAGSVYLLPDGSLAERLKGGLFPLREVAALSIQGPDQNEAGSAIAAIALEEGGDPAVFVGSPGRSASGYNTLGAVYLVPTAELTGEVVLELPDGQSCPEGTSFCLVNTDAPAGRLGDALSAGWLDDEGTMSPYLLAAAPGLDLGRGSVSLVLGSTNFGERLVVGSEPVYTLLGERVGDGFGVALATASLDGDGLVEALIGAPGRESQGGAVYAVNMNVFDAGGWAELGQVDPDQSLLVTGVEEYSRLGAALAAGDLDEDGHDDLVVGTQCVSEFCADHAYVLEGGQMEAGGQPVSDVAIADIRWSDREDDERVSWAGPAAHLEVEDVDQDGTPDLTIGRPAAADEAGTTCVVYGPVEGALDLSAELAPEGVLMIGPVAVGDRLGSALAGGPALGASLPLAVGVPHAFDGGGALYVLPQSYLAAAH